MIILTGRLQLKEATAITASFFMPATHSDYLLEIGRRSFL
jgi:hypothetical protein